MNLYLLTQSENNGYDTYDSCIVAAESEEEARTFHASGHNYEGTWQNGTWASKPENVTVELIGKAKKGTKAGVILASFNAG